MELADWWAGAHGIRLTPTSRPVVGAYLRRARWFRWIGASIGLAVPLAWTLLRDEAFPVGGLPVVLAGYLSGAILAEATRLRPRTEGAAAVAARRLDDYVPRWITMSLRGLAVLAAALIPVYAAVGGSSPPAPWLTRSGFAALSVAVVAVAVATELVQRLLVARRQSASSAGEVEVDNAIRSSSVHVLAGGGVALAALILSEQFIALSKGFEALPARWLLTGLASTGWVGAIAAWMHLSVSTPWRVRRAIRGLPS